MKKILVLMFLILITGCSQEEAININEEQTNDINNSVYQLEVITNNINIREKATIDSKKIGVINKGEIYTIKDFDFDDNYLWYKIKTKNGIEGYIASEYSSKWVKILEPDTIEKMDIILTLKGEEEVLVKKDGKYNEPGYENSSNAKVNVIGDVDTSIPGKYLLKYRAVDYYGNEKDINRSVIVYITNGMSEQLDDLEVTVVDKFNLSLANVGNNLIKGAGSVICNNTKKDINDNFELHVDETKDIKINVDYAKEIKYYIYCLPTNNNCATSGLPIIIE